eukprot:TRINITY_DN7388_c0_g3_i1.p1 TRINITY_DN7388_c0_g3~~TRINITY_DN7388_c0_g3_i1.p1  ORF type:complete len:610 (+),score=113.78 TRINITY_DN7388_c0_g3_i1:85-1914(+)
MTTLPQLLRHARSTAPTQDPAPEPAVPRWADLHTAAAEGFPPVPTPPPQPPPRRSARRAPACDSDEPQPKVAAPSPNPMLPQAPCGPRPPPHPTQADSLQLRKMLAGCPVRPPPQVTEAHRTRRAKTLESELTQLRTRVIGQAQAIDAAVRDAQRPPPPDRATPLRPLPPPRPPSGDARRAARQAARLRRAQATLTIQLAWRSCRARATRAALEEQKCRYRDQLIKEMDFWDRDDSARIIQRWWRGVAAERSLLQCWAETDAQWQRDQEHYAAQLIGKVARGLLARRHARWLRWTHPRRHRAAEKVQRGWRQCLARREHRRRRKRRWAQNEMLLWEDGTLALQSAGRGAAERLRIAPRYRSFKTAITAGVAAALAATVGTAQAARFRKRGAALCMQCFWRRMRARAAARLLRRHRYAAWHSDFVGEAAQAVTAAFRIPPAKRRAAAQRERLRLGRELAASCIQRAVRSSGARSRVKALRKIRRDAAEAERLLGDRECAAELLQRCGRGLGARAAAGPERSKRKKAAWRIGRWWRYRPSKDGTPRRAGWGEEGALVASLRAARAEEARALQVGEAALAIQCWRRSVVATRAQRRKAYALQALLELTCDGY